MNTRKLQFSLSHLFVAVGFCAAALTVLLQWRPGQWPKQIPIAAFCLLISTTASLRFKASWIQGTVVGILASSSLLLIDIARYFAIGIVHVYVLESRNRPPYFLDGLLFEAVMFPIAYVILYAFTISASAGVGAFLGSAIKRFLNC